MQECRGPSAYLHWWGAGHVLRGARLCTLSRSFPPLSRIHQESMSFLEFDWEESRYLKCTFPG